MPRQTASEYVSPIACGSKPVSATGNATCSVFAASAAGAAIGSAAARMAARTATTHVNRRAIIGRPPTRGTAQGARRRRRDARRSPRSTSGRSLLLRARMRFQAPSRASRPARGAGRTACCPRSLRCGRTHTSHRPATRHRRRAARARLPISRSRARRRRSRVATAVASPPVIAAMPARCTNTGEHDVLYSISLPISGIRASGAMIQPRRQPVISQALEKLFALTTRASRPAMSRNDGAQLALSAK